MPRSDSASNPELEASILQAPDNADAYLVYGDWLQRQGDPRGELIALQHAAMRARGDEARKLKEEVSAFIGAHRATLLGELADALDEAELEDDLAVEWHLGFIRTARVGQKDQYSGRDIAGLVKQLLTHPSTRFLRGLTIGMASFEPPNDYLDVIKALIEALRERGGSKTLQHLFIGDFQYPEEVRMSGSFLGDLRPLYALLPDLRSLRLRGSEAVLGNIDVPELREFTLETTCLSPHAAKAIAAAKWPKLERLEVWFGANSYIQGSVIEDIQPILDGQGLPGLKSLGLCNAEFIDALCALLPKAKVLSQLEQLDLSRGLMSDEGARILAKNAAAFAHLAHLDVTQNTLTGEGTGLIATLCPSVSTGDQREFDQDYRYVAVGE
ncbi:TIGR02996 domain-containing protein [Pyxidicoccus sp. MSG2]|uniref:TIGR02996 domain-containing protein n=1 Tax=Pyxidicoccus sp. MSG2 TaxID=2996790 RepID=UPI002270EBDF|nr:TIGR02996 domain-containing protein [Pyxidicoccus sp. MSG2]MCY1014944.1 TIGR02996 domain-containing protein [Pyxidicoccus sp. MSG2]